MGFAFLASWRASSECLHEAHGLPALRAEDYNRLLRHGDRGAYRQRVEQGADAGKLFLGRRTLPSVGAHPSEPLGRDVLQEHGAGQVGDEN